MSQVFRIIPPAPERPPEVRHAEAMSRGANCIQCPLYGCGRGPVMGTVRPGAPLTIIGEAPGKNEVDQGESFVGWSGAILDYSLFEGGLQRFEATVTNVILCQPPEGGNYQAYIDGIVQSWKRRVQRAIAKKRQPPPPPVLPNQACAPRLARDVAETGSTTILAVGKQALLNVSSLLGVAHGNMHVQPGAPYVASIKKQHGAPVLLDDGRTLMSSYHPAMAARGRKEYLPVIKDNIERAAAVAKRGGRIDWKEPFYKLSPTAREVVEFCQKLVAAQAEVTVDLETGPSIPGRKDGADTRSCVVRCVGIGAQLGPEGRDEQVMVVPFRHMDGSDWWRAPDGSVDQESKIAAALALRDVMDKCPLAGQNFSFDSNVMLRVGLMSEFSRMKPWSDTLLLHHNTPDNDLPHDLGFIARRYFEAPMWKTDIDHKSVDNVNDANLHLYNARDVLITMRLLAPLREEIGKRGTLPQYQTDTALGPVLREMGNIGLVVDEERRGQFSEVLNWQCGRELYRFREVVGDATINPRSVPQLQELIFQRWGYLPVIGTDGYEIQRVEHDIEWKQQLLREDDVENESEYDENELGSTSSAALIEMMKKREMKEEHIEALKVLLEYRAYDKLRGTYVDNLKVRPVLWDTFGYAVPELPAVRALVWDRKLGGYADKEVIAARSGLSLLNTIYKGHVIPTGRLATQPAVQNWPALGKMNMREMVVAPPGHVLVGADYAQLEARLYAVAAQDALLLQTIADGQDIHSMNAAALMARNLDELQYWYRRVEHGEGIDPSKRKSYRKYWRTIAKRFAFLEIYGGEEDKLFSVMSQQRDKNTGQLAFPNLKRADVEMWHDNWHTLHPWTKMWHARCKAFCDEYGYSGVQDIDFRKRFFLGGVSKKNAVPNMQIQGWAASIANRALLRLVDAIPFRSWSPWTGVNLQVHDYVGMYVPESRAKEASRIVAECMFYEYGGIEFPAGEPDETGTYLAGISHRWSGQD